MPTDRGKERLAEDNTTAAENRARAGGRASSQCRPSAARSTKLRSVLLTSLPAAAQGAPALSPCFGEAALRGEAAGEDSPGPCDTGAKKQVKGNRWRGAGEREGVEKHSENKTCPWQRDLLDSGDPTLH